MKYSKKELIERDQKHLIHPIHSRKMQMNAHVWIKGKGCILTDADGKEYLDGLSGLWNVVAGHGRKEIVDAATQQMGSLAYCSSYAGSSNLEAILLAERIASITYPSINQFFFTSGGGESSETSFKLARSYWKLQGKPNKTKVISLKMGYHGVTLAAMSATGISTYWPAFEPRTPGFLHISSPYPYRYKPANDMSPGLAAANELEDMIEREGADNIAMFIAEPVQGAGGVIIPQDDYFPRIREICDKYDVLLAADEVITGFGRTGKLFALDHWGIEPDLMQFAKAITSGYFPFGGVGINDNMAETLGSSSTPWMHAYTYSAHPVGCAVANRTIDIIINEDFPSQARLKGRYLLDGLTNSLANHPNVGEVRGIGLMCAVEMVKDRLTKDEFSPSDDIGNKVHIAAQRRGLFSRLRGDVFCIAPPVITTTNQLNRIIEILTDSINEVLPH